jgi:dihydroflavonol-4-reductase
MRSPDAAGQRFVAAGDFLWFSDVAAILREHFGPKAARAPKRNMPDWVVRAAALFSPELAYIAPNLGLRQITDASKAEQVLGWKTRPAAGSIIDAANNLCEGA